MSLAVSLAPFQVEAACRLHDRLPQWCLADRALAALAQRLPGWTPEEVVVKAVTVNSLYGTNVFAIMRMAEHIVTIMAAAGSHLPSVELVEAIARLPKPNAGAKDRSHWSFASKFAHFFIDPSRFPIYDWYALMTVRYHLGRAWQPDAVRPYRSFVEGFDQVKDLAELPAGTREFDRYLWIAGQHRYWQAKPHALINGELRRLFEAPGDAAADLQAVCLGMGA